ncbi:MAG: small multi-drug export protein [Clostridia bacterium]|nr:small multi-drug export protein [Clostridia bacterium]
MTPVLELRVAIPFGVANDLGLWPSIIISIIGNLIPVPFIILFIRQIFAFMRKLSPKLDKLVTKLEQRAEKKSAVVQKCAFWGLFLLVAIPLPGTGAWTGALVAAMLDMRLKRAFPSIALGVTAAAIIVTFITYGADKLLF